MIDKNLLRLLGSNKKYIFYAVGLMVLGLFANVGITASICWAINLAIHYDEYSGGAIIFLWPAVCAVIGIAIRYTASRLVGDLKDLLGRKAKKDLREKVYNKIVTLGVRSTDGMSMAGLTQVSMEGVEQLDLYYSSYIPQFFYAMLAPFVLFGITVWIEWRVALVLLCCVPLIPVSIIAVSKYAKKIFAKYWGKYRCGTFFYYCNCTLGNRTGAVVNDSPVDCQSRDLDRPQAAIPLAFTRRKGIAQICGTFFLLLFCISFLESHLCQRRL